MDPYVEEGRIVLDQLVEHMFAKRFLHQLRAFGQRDRLLERARQGVDLQLVLLRLSHLEDILLDRSRQVVLPFDPLQPGGQDEGKGQVRVGGWIRRAKFDTSRLLLADAVHRDTDQR